MKHHLHIQTSEPRSVFPKILLFTALLFLPLMALAQWESANEPPGLLGIQLKVVNEDTIFCASEANGKIYRTTDGSENWDTFQTSVSDAEFLDFDFPTPEVGYAICQSSASSTPVLIFKTPDGGTTWDSLSLDAMDYIGPCNVHFLNADTGFVSNGNNILRTVDGTNFTSFELSSEPNEVVQALTATSDGVVFVSTEFVGGLPDEINRYSIYRSADVGET